MQLSQLIQMIHFSSQDQNTLFALLEDVTVACSQQVSCLPPHSDVDGKQAQLHLHLTCFGIVQFHLLYQILQNFLQLSQLLDLNLCIDISKYI